MFEIRYGGETAIFATYEEAMKAANNIYENNNGNMGVEVINLESGNPVSVYQAKEVENA